MRIKTLIYLVLILTIVWFSGKEVKSSEVICYPEGSCVKRARADNNIIVITPAEGERLLNTSPPIFVELDSQTYTVKLENSQGTLFKENFDNHNPVDIPELTPGYYQLTIQTNDTEITRSFEVLEKKESVYIKQQTNTKINSLDLAEFYQENNLITEARKTLEQAIEKGVDNKSEAIAIYQMLGDLYLKKINAPLKAKENYGKALEEAQGIEDKQAQANAYIGLAKVSIELGLNEKEEYQNTIKKLKEAYNIYQNLGQDFHAAQVQQFIGEVYFDSNDNQEALKWFQEARNSYQKIDKEKYEESINKEIQKICEYEENLPAETQKICDSNL